MVDRTHIELPVTRQCELVGVSRATVYREPTSPSNEDLSFMRLIDEEHLRHPFYGSRRMTLWLRSQGHPVNRKRIERLMRWMGLEGMAPGPSTSRPHPQHPVYPYLLRDLQISRANHVWATDITYIPMAQGFAYLVAIMDWYSRRVLAWRLSNTLDTTFCIEALDEALRRHGTPEIFNTDQGAQFTAKEFTHRLKSKAIRISMDGRGRCLDNVFVERLWRSVKYEHVYLHAYDNLREARRGLTQYFAFYNRERPHRALRDRTPETVYRLSLGEAA